MEREIDPYWTADEIIGELRHGREEYLLRLRLHESAERYHRDPHELFPLAERRGERVYYHAKPYVTPPDVELTVRQQDVGQAQAWYYPRERALVLWECFLEDRYRSGDDPQGDPGHVALWDGFERTLLARQPDTM